jgi:rare lipoprotein A
MKKWANSVIAAVLFVMAPTLALAGDETGVVAKQKGVASYYGKKFNHKKTASGVPLDPTKKTIASKTLPIGTKAEVTNTENGKKTDVVVTDRGPYVKNRIIDVTPKVAEALDMKEDGVTRVEVKPIEVPHTEEQKKVAVEHPPQ